MQEYLNLLSKISTEGNDRGGRTGTGTRSLFGERLVFDLTKGLPVVTTKKVHLKAVIHELLWFLSGSTNIKYLKDNGVKIWDAWSDDNGDLGPVYGKQWRDWDGVDQIADLVDSLKNNPEDRRMIVNAWNVGEIDKMALPPCHMFFQVYSRYMSITELRKTYMDDYPEVTHMILDDVQEFCTDNSLPIRYLDLLLYQRSADMFLGVPFNIASYAILMEMLAAQTNHIAHRFTHDLGDAHIYSNHVNQVGLQLSKHPRSLPTITLNKDVESIFDYKFDDITIDGYDPHPVIKAPVAV